MMSWRFSLRVLACGAALIASFLAHAQDLAITDSDFDFTKKQYSPYLHQSFPDQVFWGDTHLHTSFSFDAAGKGNTLAPEAALRFARGETVTSSTGVPARLIRPLDFLVISDHAEFLGLAPLIQAADPELLRDPEGRAFFEMVASGRGAEAYRRWERNTEEGRETLTNRRLLSTPWRKIIDAVDRFNQPGVFTTFHGFEWTPTPDQRNLHRVVVFRDGAAEARQVLPLRALNPDPQSLWSYLEAYEAKTGGRALAIPHNGNISNGLMFAVEKGVDGDEPIDAAYAERRMRWEPLYEVTQTKGDSEAHPLLSPDDEFADYYTWDKGDFGTDVKSPEMLPHEYARSALRIGLEQAEKLGVNPFKFGMVGATDSHTSLTTPREENYFGKSSTNEPGAPKRFDGLVIDDQRETGNDGSLKAFHWETAAAGVAGVWARENTREAIWDAMARKEVYATTGSRMLVRIFAGWDFAPDDVHRPNFAEQGYLRGVPMGGDLAARPEGASPQFMVVAQRDPEGANLDRIQIIKGWTDDQGQSHERIFDVAVSDGRTIDADGRCRTPVGDTVNLAAASYTNTIGDAVLVAHWEDPTFDPDERAFYYARVLEIPTPSWVAYDEASFEARAPDEAVRKQQDRAYTSPIWYAPES